MLTMPEGVSLDLGATAKAWAADRSAARIARQPRLRGAGQPGRRHRGRGPAPDGGWRIRVQDVTGSPDDPPEGPYALIAIRDGGLATSSTSARRWQRGGDVLHHILDPRTGLPAEPVLADRLGRRGDLRGRQRREHGRDHPRPAGAGLAGRARPARPPGRRDRRGLHRRGLARGHPGRPGMHPRAHPSTNKDPHEPRRRERQRGHPRALQPRLSIVRVISEAACRLCPPRLSTIDHVTETSLDRTNRTSSRTGMTDMSGTTAFWYASRATGDRRAAAAHRRPGARHPGQPAGPPARPAQVRGHQPAQEHLAAGRGLHRRARGDRGARHLRQHPGQRRRHPVRLRLRAVLARASAPSRST